VALRRRADRHPETIRAWRGYKGDNDLVGFADMLERVAQRSLVPNVDYLIIDEFQDITTLQYNVFEEGNRTCGRCSSPATTTRSSTRGRAPTPTSS